jgi:gliding motility-associated-like protein
MKRTATIFLTLCFLTSLGQVPPYVPISGLIGWWPFNGNTNDVSSNGHNGTLVGATLSADRNGIANQAYLFSPNTTSVITLPLCNTITNNYTVTMWLKPNRTVNVVTESSLCLGANSVPMANSNQNWAISPSCCGIGGQGVLATGLSVGTNGIFLGEHTGNLLVARLVKQGSYTTYTNVTLVYKGDSTLLYINGQLARARTYCNSDIKTLQNSLRIGQAVFSPNFSGVVDDVGVWNRALTPCEIQQIYLEIVQCNNFNCSIQIGDTTICAGNSVVLSDSVACFTSPYLYHWSTGATTQSITVTPAQTTGYSVTATYNGSSCVDSITVFVTNPPTGLGNITGTTIACANGTQIYTVGSANNATGYNWTVGTGGTILSGQGNDTISVSWDSVGTFPVTVTASNVCGNSASSTISVTVVNSMILTISAIAGNDTACTGMDSVMNGISIYSVQSSVGAANYTWTLSGGGTIISGQGTTSIVVNWTGTGQQNVSVVASNSCTSSSAAAHPVFVNLSPTATINPSTPFICSSLSSVTLTASGGNLYLWSTGAITSSIDVSPALGNTYTVNVGYVYNSCRGTASRTVASYPTAGIIPTASTICSGQNTTLTGNGGVAYVWSTGDTTSTITITPSQTSTYTVTVTNIFGCSSSSPTTITVNIAPTNPTTSVENDTICQGESTVISASNSTGGTVAYNFYDAATNGNLLGASPLTVSPALTTIYYLEAINQYNCTSDSNRIPVTITVNCETFPNAFTPNGDGKNDVYLKNYDLTILNRWGQELFSGLTGWDGTYNGKRVTPGTYFYIVKQNNKTIKGTVAVVEP